MDVKIAALADYMNITNNGKLNILGVFSRIMASTIPVVHPKMVLVAQFEFDPTETGETEIRIVLVDEDGREILSVSGIANVPRQPDGKPTQYNQMVELVNTTFPHFGRYEFRILIGRSKECTVPFDVMRVDEPPSQD